MTFRHYTLLSAALFFAAASHAQFEGFVYREDSAIKASASGHFQHLAWTGGTSNPQPAQADLNNDGKPDLVIYEWGSAQVKTFINDGTAGLPKYVYAPAYAATFPSASDYLYLLDYNNDNIPDLFEKGCCGFNAWKGYYNADGKLAFQFYKELRYESPFVGSVNAYSQASDVPGITDVDGDGDLDFFAYDINGAILSFYKNCRTEHGLPPDSIRICYPESCWGRTYQSTVRAFDLDVTDCPTFGLFGCKTTLHPGNTLCFADIDGDGDKDLLDGNLSFNDIQLLINGNSTLAGSDDKIIAQDTQWQSSGHMLQLPAWPLGTWMDYDGDGDKDLIFTPHARNVSEDVRTIQWYRNAGSDASPSFTWSGDSLLTAYGIDAGTASYPHIADMNADGRPDLLLGAEGRYKTGGGRTTKLLYFQNLLISGQTVLSLVNDNYLSLDTSSYIGAAPATGDLDGDGDADLLVGHSDGTLSYYRNDAGAGAPASFTLMTQQLADASGAKIDVGYAAAPFIYDLNKDGKQDVLIGRLRGNVFYYENVPGGGTFSLTLANNNLGGMAANPENTFSGYSVPYVGKMDGSGIDYILLGADSGGIRRYTGFQEGITTGTYTLLDDAYSYINTGLRSAPAAGDLDGDGKTEMLVGNSLGGLQQYTQSVIAGAPAFAADMAAQWVAYPNPATTSITIRKISRGLPEQSEALLFDATGRRIAQQAGSQDLHINVAAFPPGAYYLSIHAPSGSVTLPVSIVR